MPRAMPAPDDDHPRRRDPEATRAAILEAAETLFVERGPSATATSAVARRAGVTKSLIHHHFGSKEDLWEEVRKRHFERYYEAQIQMLENAEGTAELLRDSVVAYFRFLQEEPNAVRFFSWRFIEAEDPSLDLEEELFDLGMERIRQAQASGELRADLEPIVIIKAFLGMVFYWFQSKSFLCQIMGEDWDEDAMDETYIEDVVKIFMEGIRPR